MNGNEMLEKALDQSLELNRIQGDMLKEKQKSNRMPYIFSFVTLGILLATIFGFIWLWNQYDTVSSIEATGIYTAVDHSGNIVAQDIDAETWQMYLDWLEGVNNGNIQNNENQNP